MEPNSNNPKKVVVIRMDGSNLGPTPDPELMAWLASFIDQLTDEQFGNFSARVSVNGDHADEPTEMQEIEYLDGMVEGDEHPEAIEMIMSAYHKHREV
jgi:hypothetical protein